jgi:DNA-directed RNA polymerase subunit M/transcription elongation factor TFIIS
MKFCSICSRTIKKNISMGNVIFKCVCGNIEKTLPEDSLISDPTISENETMGMYDNLIEFAPFDRTNQLIKMDCPTCGLDYLTQIRVGTSEVIIYRCKCGYKKIVNS